MQTKICTSCKRNLPHADYYKNPTSADGYQANCKICSIYKSMVNRCTKHDNTRYSDYGGRGIKICSRWLKSVNDFITDLGPRPDGASLDRINNNGNYEPNNCRWADQSTQVHNQRIRSTNHSGYKGVLRYSDTKWRATLHHKKQKLLDSYHITKADAIQARLLAERLYLKEEFWQYA